jgi:hypothetical protein
MLADRVAAAVPCFNEGGKSSAKLSAPTGSNTTIDTKLDPDASIEDDITDASGWPLVTPSQGYSTPYFASYKATRSYRTNLNKTATQVQM